MGVIELFWVIFIALKIAGIAFVTTSWWWIILWPIPVYLVLWLII